MDKLETLKLSKKELDTSEAQKYINEINNLSGSVHPNLMNIVSTKELNEIEPLMNTRHITSEETCKKLAMKIVENEDMFVQLEHLVRGTDERDVRDGHIRLMSQLLRCSPALWNNVPHKLVVMTEDTPLYNLAAVVGTTYWCDTYNKPAAVVITNKAMRPLCKYFAELCLDVGIQINLIIMNASGINELKALKRLSLIEEDHAAGCTGVIAERSDLDSAIDAFIYSSITAPWRLKQIYVQESVFEDFKEALAARTRGPGTSDVAVGNKTFLIECLSSGQSGIPTHAYRTTKELLSLIETPYLSVWAAETAVSHEIALRSSARTVWLNEYGTFYGPPRTALSVYNLSSELPTYCTNKLKKDQKKWAELQATERMELIVAAIKKCEDVAFLSNFTENWCSNDLLHVTGNTVCFGVQQPLGIVHIDCQLEWLKVLKILLNGNAVVLGKSVYSDKITALQEMGIPIEEIDRNAGTVTVGCAPMIVERLKVVRTNYGTIFAN